MNREEKDATLVGAVRLQNSRYLCLTYIHRIHLLTWQIH